MIRAGGLRNFLYAGLVITTSELKTEQPAISLQTEARYNEYAYMHTRMLVLARMLNDMGTLDI